MCGKDGNERLFSNINALIAAECALLGAKDRFLTRLDPMDYVFAIETTTWMQRHLGHS